MAQLTLTAEQVKHANRVAEAAGSADIMATFIKGLELTVSDVSQAALDAAFAAFDFSAADLQFASEEVASAIQDELDKAAQAKGYDSIISAASYVGYINAFQAECVALATWRSDVWAYCYAQLNAIGTGARAMPATVEAFVTEVLTVHPAP